jgi:hypothetical protein
MSIWRKLNFLHCNTWYKTTQKTKLTKYFDSTMLSSNMESTFLITDQKYWWRRWIQLWHSMRSIDHSTKYLNIYCHTSPRYHQNTFLQSKSPSLLSLFIWKVKNKIYIWNSAPSILINAALSSCLNH